MCISYKHSINKRKLYDVLSWSAISVFALGHQHRFVYKFFQFVILNLKSYSAFNSATYRSEEFNLIHRCLRVVLRTLYHLHCNKSLHPATTEQVTFANRKQQVLQIYRQITFNLRPQKQNSAIRIWSAFLKNRTGCPRRAIQSKSDPSPVFGLHGTFHCKDLLLLHGDSHLHEKKTHDD